MSVAGVQPGTWEEMRLAKSAGLSGAVGSGGAAMRCRFGESHCGGWAERRRGFRSLPSSLFHSDLRSVHFWRRGLSSPVPLQLRKPVHQALPLSAPPAE